MQLQEKRYQNYWDLLLLQHNELFIDSKDTTFPVALRAHTIKAIINKKINITTKIYPLLFSDISYCTKIEY